MKCCLICSNVDISLGEDDYYDSLPGHMRCTMANKSACPWDSSVGKYELEGQIDPIPFISIAEKCPYYKEVKNEQS